MAIIGHNVGSHNLLPSARLCCGPPTQRQASHVKSAGASINYHLIQAQIDSLKTSPDIALVLIKSRRMDSPDPLMVDEVDRVCERVSAHEALDLVDADADAIVRCRRRMKREALEEARGPGGLRAIDDTPLCMDEDASSETDLWDRPEVGGSLSEVLP